MLEELIIGIIILFFTILNTICIIITWFIVSLICTMNCLTGCKILKSRKLDQERIHHVYHTLNNDCEYEKQCLRGQEKSIFPILKSEEEMQEEEIKLKKELVKKNQKNK